MTYDTDLERLTRELMGLEHTRSPYSRVVTFFQKLGIRSFSVRDILRARSLRTWMVRIRRALDQSLKIRRTKGQSWPLMGVTMLGKDRLTHLRECAEDISRKGIPGDIVEAGVWRGGAAMLCQAALLNRNDKRTLWLADSFDGLPPPNAAAFPADDRSILHMFTYLAVSADEVRRNFERYGLPTDNVQFLEGWFRDTLKNAPIERIALLHVDADMYESTWEVLDALYSRVSSGGYVVIDDYGDIAACKQATDTFRMQHGISEPLYFVDQTGVYWQKI